MNKRNVLLIASLGVLALVGGLVLFRYEASVSVDSQTRTVASAPQASRVAAQGQRATEAPQDAAAAMSGEPTQAADIATATEAASNEESEQDDGEIGFKADAGGNIVLNENTRLDLERLHALYSPAEREKKLEELSATLPPAAARELHQLMDQYRNYQAAAYQAYPPDREMTSVEQGVSQIDGMHGLRVQFFGEQATEKMFGEEEKAQRALYKLMENENDPGLTVQEKAERAQQIYLEQQRR